MALRVDWSPEAVEDIESIASYIERDSEWYAKAVVSRFIELAEAAAQFPEAGRAVPELDDPVIRGDSLTATASSIAPSLIAS